MEQRPSRVRARVAERAPAPVILAAALGVLLLVLIVAVIVPR